MSNSFMRLKPLASLQHEADNDLQRHLGLGSLTLMGVGATIGAGIFVLTGTAAANYAGPAVALSFVIAGVACLCAALCYAELASMLPCSGSAYSYVYATMGEALAWAVGWSLVLEYLFATSTVAVGWSGYFSALLASAGVAMPESWNGPPFHMAASGGLEATGAIVNLPAVLIVLALGAVLTLGIRTSNRMNAAMVLLKIAVILLVVGLGAFYVKTANWTPFVPPNAGAYGQFGWTGVVRAAGVVFYAYIGFDMLSASAQEAKNPRRDIPLSLLFALGICTILYIAMSLVMTGLAPYRELNVPHPVYVAIAHAGPGLAWLAPLTGVGVLIGFSSAMLMCLYGQSRIFYRMALDGLIPPAFSKLSEARRVPVFGTWFVTVCAAAVAGILPIDLLGQLVSIGTLFAFAIVCAGVLVLRRAAPDRPRAFRAPAVWPVALTGIAACTYMMVSLPQGTWVRLIVWLAIGAAVYGCYGRKRSKLAPVTFADGADPAPAAANL